MSVYNEAGKYRAKVIGACLVKSESSGNDQVLITLEIHGKYQEGYGLAEYPAPQYPPEVYMALTDGTMGTPASPGWVAQTLAYMGFDGDFDNLHLLLSQFHDAICKHEEGLQGGLVERWSILRPGGVRAVAPPEKKQVRELNSRFGNLFSRKPAAQPAPTNGNGHPPSDATSAEPKPVEAKPAPRPRKRAAVTQQATQPAGGFTPAPVTNNEDIPF
jgi:hypothetical protein